VIINFAKMCFKIYLTTNIFVALDVVRKWPLQSICNYVHVCVVGQPNNVLGDRSPRLHEVKL